MTPLARTVAPSIGSARTASKYQVQLFNAVNVNTWVLVVPSGWFKLHCVTASFVSVGGLDDAMLVLFQSPDFLTTYVNCRSTGLAGGFTANCSLFIGGPQHGNERNVAGPVNPVTTVQYFTVNNGALPDVLWQQAVTIAVSSMNGATINSCLGIVEYFP